MKIAIDARYLNASPSTLAHYCENLVEHLAMVDTENEYEVFINSGFQKTLRLGGNFNIHKVRSQPLSWRTLARFHARVQRSGAEALHSLYPIVPLGYRGPLVVTAHNLKPYLLRESEENRFFLPRRIGEYVSRWIFPIAMNRAKWVLPVSNSTREALREWFPDIYHKSIVVPPGLNPAYMAPLEEKTRDLVLAKYELPKRFIFYTGEVRPSKNVGQLLTALAYLRNSDDDFGDLDCVVAAPGGRWLGDAKKQAERLRIGNSVHFFNQLSDVERQAFYLQSKAFCMPCKDEGFGFQILEAQALGIPVLAADSGALPEIAGAGALLANADHVPSLVDALRLILSSEPLRKQLVAAGHKNVRRYSWKKAAESVRDIYNLLM